MSEIADNTPRQDFRIRDLLSEPHDVRLFNRGSIAGEHYDPLIESQGSFADEVLARIQEVVDKSGYTQGITKEPAFILGVVSSVSARREAMEQAEMAASISGWEGSE